MKIVRLILTFTLAAAILILQSCGGAGSGVASLNTTMVTATVDTLILDSDIVAWVDATGAKATWCGSTSIPSTPASDSVNVTVTPKAYSNTVSNALPVRVESATISYEPANTSTPPMASEYQTIGQVIQAPLSVPVRVSSQEQKQSLFNVLACNGIIYNYYVTISINVTEVGTDKKDTVTTKMQLRFSDYLEK